MADMPSSPIEDLVGRSQVPILDPKSRYAGLPLTTRVIAGGQVAYLSRRLLPLPESLESRGKVSPRTGDRPDTIAARALGDPLYFWMLADANGVLDPWDLPKKSSIVVPAPQFREGI